MAKRPRFSRFKRLPGLYRIGERKPPDPNLEPQRLSLYLPGTTLDRAEAQARRAGIETIQEYCEQLLRRVIDAEHDRTVVEETEARRGPLEGLDAVANDPEYLAEWTASASPRRQEPARPAAEPESERVELTEGAEGATVAPQAASESAAALTVMRHAAMFGEDPSALLVALRRREPVDPNAAHELIRALGDLEVEYRPASRLDRRLAYALHRLAFEGQILLTDAWTDSTVDGATVDILRIVQEAVDRVLSGEDIRYFSPEAGPERPL